MQEQRSSNVIEINLEELLGLLIHKLWVVILSGVLVALAAFGISAFLLTPQYESTTGIYIMSKQDNAGLTYSDAQISTLLTKDYEELISCRYVLETVIKNCSLDEKYEDLKERVEVSNSPDTRIIYITVKDPDPAMAQFIANSTREVASNHIKDVTDVEAVNIVDQANLPDEPAEPSILIWTAVGAFIGLFFSVLIILIQYLSNDTIKTAEDAEKYLGWSTLAMIPVMETTVEKKAIAKKRKK